jgi:sialate O-acetylesterase
MRRWPILNIAVSALLAVFSTLVAQAEVKLPAVISDNMVLQAGKPVVIWGWDDPRQQVTVVCTSAGAAARSAAVQADQDGRWQVTLPAFTAGQALEISAKDGTSVKTVKNVLVGEVWVASGQSNMQWSVRQSDNFEQEAAAAKYPKLRMFSVTRETADEPKRDCQGRWVECSPETVGDFSAAGYFFGRHLHKELKVPVGVINTSWGGTAAEAWTSRPVLAAEPSMKPLLDRWVRQIADADKVVAFNAKLLDDWKAAVAKAKAEKKPVPKMPRLVTDPRKSPNRPASLYNAMIVPLLPYAIRGAIWYQGESNHTRAWEYRTLFPLMIRNWRQAWGQGDFPFGFVQLAPFNYHNEPFYCAELREAQRLTLKALRNTGMAVTMDIGNPKDIHPKNKQEVGRRLGLWAMATVYGKKDLEYSGPMYESMKVEGDKVRLTFSHACGGLVTRDGKAPSHFLIAGDDQRFVPAQAAIEGNQVVVSSPAVARPAAVRYAWQHDAEPNLANKEGLPASPFKTDTWRWLTEASAINTPGLDALVGDQSPLRQGERIAFLGDSITQGGVSPYGYVWLIEDVLARRLPDRKVEVIRAGISGNRVPDLQKRLERDVLSKNPSVVFIYIGINDVWHSLKGRGTPKDQYEAGLRDLIARIQKAGATVILATPSAIGEKTDGSNALDPMLNEYAQISRKVAQSTGVQLCDLRAYFLMHLKQFNPENKERGILTGDTVHLNGLGNRLVADRAADSIVAALKKRK